MNRDLTRMAKQRLLHGGPETCKRIEHQACVALEREDWNEARKLMHLRFEMRPTPTPEERATMDRILSLIDQAEAQGIGPRPLLG